MHLMEKFLCWKNTSLNSNIDDNFFCQLRHQVNFEKACHFWALQDFDRNESIYSSQTFFCNYSQHGLSHFLCQPWSSIQFNHLRYFLKASRWRCILLCRGLHGNYLSLVSKCRVFYFYSCCVKHINFHLVCLFLVVENFDDKMFYEEYCKTLDWSG